MLDMRMMWKCLFTPSLYSVMRGNQQSGRYDPNHWERWGDNLVTSIYVMWNIGIYLSPSVVYLLLRKGYFTVEGAVSLCKISLGISFIVGASYCIRSYGRSSNSRYRAFLANYEKAKLDFTDDNKKLLKQYDFEFTFWPVEYRFKSEDSRKPKETAAAGRSWSRLIQSPCSIVSYLMIHTIGIRLIYPGSIRAVNYVLSPALNQGRKKLVEEEHAQRFKLLSQDGNHIDTMFIDARGKKNNGSTLVICSEGNAGYYEIGIMVTPIEAGYSVLGWNHPGFGGSSGQPYPEQEHNAIDTVIQFAINDLGFLPEQIVLFGWSIGGYPVSWAAMAYPDIKAVVVDATFDDLLPLAIPKMPAFLESVVKTTVRQHANLDIARKLIQYPGPILIIRRAEDEIICLEPYNISTNRGNNLLVGLLRQRYPQLWVPESENALDVWLSNTGPNQVSVYSSYQIEDDWCQAALNSSMNVDGNTYPSPIGEGLSSLEKIQILLYLASKYMVDYKSTHCSPLPASLFRIPTLV